MIQILLAEDDSAIAMGLEYSLGQEGWQVTVCGDCPPPWLPWRRGVLTFICWI